MAERYDHPDVLRTLKDLGLEALLSHFTDGMEENEVDWVTPDSLMKAAERLRQLVLAQDPRVKCIVDTYCMGAIGADPVREELAQDLADVQFIARCSKEMGVPRMTLEVNW
jgi:hypothetical protein